MNADDTVLDYLTGPIIGSALTVSNALGAGFLEKVDENALAHERRKSLPRRRQADRIWADMEGFRVTGPSRRQVSKLE
jgi:hypothetical protein